MRSQERHYLVQGAVGLLRNPDPYLCVRSRQRGEAATTVRAGRHGLLGAPAPQQFLDKAGADLKGSGGLLDAHLLLLDGMHDTVAEVF